MLPVGDRILVKLEESSQITEYGIHLPEAVKQKAVQGQVISVGRITNKNEDISVGDVVLFQDNKGTEIKVGGIPHLIIKEQDILAVVGEGE